MDARDAGEDDDSSEGLNQRDRLEDDDEETAKAPPGFLSPSVREYLELGRSIPGTFRSFGFFFGFVFNEFPVEIELLMLQRPLHVYGRE